MRYDEFPHVSSLLDFQDAFFQHLAQPSRHGQLLQGCRCRIPSMGLFVGNESQGQKRKNGETHQINVAGPPGVSNKH